ncbi:NUDIX domain-containing protein [Bizionia paragorgiae]|uniref:GDP-mannose pyrophosphatase n=1 Tax=Bizionia paragorgiae TaxID=283786 RepID=A0A1H3X7Q9_BIZPA|nr:NUDIX domain-containing protein [Bizionia paragorgiae]SDZ95280.1 nudix-type nucleoside diphosphatase, YffH/AdpP family [Bizionia paragorgiae]
MPIQVKDIDKHILSNGWATLHRIDFSFQFKNKEWKRVSREVYNRKDAACVLLYNPERNCVILTKQFRMPAYLNTKEEGMSIEVCAGLIDEGESPLEAVLRETEEEVGYRVPKAKKIMEIYMSPGAITEKTHLFIAEYTPDMKVNAGGGLESENEEIEVLELPLDDALQLLQTNVIKDAKTVILLQYLKSQSAV